MSDRGMMKWAPYKSLGPTSDYLAKMAYERGKKERPLHSSSEEAEEINDVLVNYRWQAGLFTLYDDGYTEEITGKITEINSIYKYLKLPIKNCFSRYH
jgi:hypothetical protein